MNEIFLFKNIFKFLKEFANQAESIFKGSDRHTHLDKSYKALVVVIYEQIVRVASESQKTPKDVVMMGNDLLIHLCSPSHNLEGTL